MDNKDNKRGFSGLSDLSSDIGNGDATPSAKAAPAPTQHTSTNSTHTETKGNAHESKDPLGAFGIEKHAKSSGNPSLKWIYGISAIIAFIWIISLFDDNVSSPSQNTTQTYDVANQTNIPNRTTLQYDMPPVGTQNILNYKEICWCVREGIRIEAIRSQVSNDLGAQQFNNLVNGYNSKCGSFKYHNGDLERAQRDVEIYRNEIVAKALEDAQVINGNPKGTDNVNYIPRQNYTHERIAKKQRKTRNQNFTAPIVRRKPEPQYEYVKDSPSEIEIPKPLKEHRPVQLTDLTPDQQAAVELACFEKKIKGKPFFDECVKRKLASKK